MTLVKPSREALEAAEESRREGRRIYNREHARRSLAECETLAIARTLDRFQAEEREVLAATLLKVAASNFLEYKGSALQVTHEAKCVLEAIATELRSGEGS